jgi:hypothetical protein
VRDKDDVAAILLKERKYLCNVFATSLREQNIHVANHDWHHGAIKAIYLKRTQSLA